MWQNLSTRERRLVLVTLIVLLGVFCYRMIFLPELSRLWSLEEKTANLHLRILEMERALTLGDRIERQYTDYESIIAQKGTPLEESTAFFKTLADITKANNMNVLSQMGIPTESSRYYNIFSIRMGVKTRPVWLARFLASLEKSKELIRVEDIAIKALDNDENLSVNMKLTKVVAEEREESL